ncbi:ParB/RepB/Spo0J family partition protein [Fimbriiglobus ruber]|uniref:Chromosome (Plasmid) partitioning protein ParB n=1 Tax=Fimbriiglobus ruber TaxID=1908690 RepID=A0A225E0V1_9BACT|nr:ParB/RepB/Spo0J family partition protein [Fimbriiglobus ruber]OWK45434.1 Chromosome (plasmid) partitioning protein ParB [Fimbriiglobus ruber]
MSATTMRLGRGLDALLGNGATGPNTTADRQAAARVDQIRENPFQPRKRFDDDELKELTDSVRTHGILQPLVVRSVGDHFQLIAGERRLRAATAAGLTTVPVHVVEFNDQQVYEAALVENVQRTDLNPIEKAHAFKDYLDRFGMTQEQLGTRLGLNRTTVSTFINLLNLHADVQNAVRLGQISLGHAKLLRGADPERQVALCKEVILKNLSVHGLEQHIKEQKAQEQAAAAGRTAEPREAGEKVEKTAHVMSLENEIRQRLAVKFEIRVKNQDKGQIVIGFETNDDFERIIEALRK